MSIMINSKNKYTLPAPSRRSFLTSPVLTAQPGSRRSFLTSPVLTHKNNSGIHHKQFSIFLITVLALSLSLPCTSAQDDTQLRLPPDAKLLWDVSTGTHLKTLKVDIGHGHTDLVLSVSFSPDGQTLASGGADGSAQLWHADTGDLLKTLKAHTGWVTDSRLSQDVTVPNFSLSSKHSVLSISFSPDGQTLASGSRDKTIRLWDVGTGKHLKTLKGHKGSVTSVSFSPDGKTLVSGSTDQTVRLWDLHRKPRFWDVIKDSHLKIFKGHTGAVLSVSFSPDGKTLASGGSDGAVRLWHADTGTLLKASTGHIGSVECVHFSPDGKTLASGCVGGAVRLWSTNTGNLLKAFHTHTGAVLSVSFSPNGKQIASLDTSHSIRLWSADTGNLLKILKGHKGSVLSISFSPDGETLVSSSEDGTLLKWNTSVVK